MIELLIALAQAGADGPLPLPEPPKGAGDSPWPGMMMAAGAVLLLFIVMSNLRKKVSRRQAAHVDPREQVEETRQTNALRNDTRQMMIELEDLTRRFGAQLDAKSTKLERLLDEADAKIAELRAAIDGGARPGDGGSDGPARELPAQAEPEEINPLAKDIYKLADEGRSAVDIARELGEHVGEVELILALRQQNA